MPPKVDLTDMKFGRLTVIERSATRRRHVSEWTCRCDCGKTLNVPTDKLNSGNTKSCGCLQRDKARARLRTHGACETPEYRVWRSMRERCRLRPHPRYGGRGINVCDRWFNSFADFIADIGPRPTPKHTLERINGEGHYEPSNCKWATWIEQNNNKSGIRKVTINGQADTIANWCRRLGINRDTVSNRIHNLGWSYEDALTKPVKSRQAPCKCSQPNPAT
jgi:hypothetical protein